MPKKTLLSSPISLQLKKNLNVPILVSLLENRTMGLAIAGTAALHSGLVILGIPSWQCPLRHGLRIPCPGCGLSRAITTLIRGDWQTSLTFHAFAPLFLVALILITGVTLLPSPHRRRVINCVEVVERHTGITAILLIGLVFYWLIRLLILREGFVDLIMGQS